LTNTYLDFINDEDLFECIGNLYKGYKKALISKDIKAFFKERVDPIKFIFDSKIQNISMEEYIGKEILRQTDKSISNYIGTFHEELLGKIQGYSNLAVGGGIDLKSDDGLMVAEIKNKHNTVKGENRPDIFKKLERYIDNDNSDSIGYYVKIIDRKSQNTKWVFKAKEYDYNNEQIYQISGDQFYELVTKDPSAFAKLCSVMPSALNAYIEKLPEEEVINIEDATVVEEIKRKTGLENPNDEDLLTTIFKINFATYTGFNDFKIATNKNDGIDNGKTE